MHGRNFIRLSPFCISFSFVSALIIRETAQRCNFFPPLCRIRIFLGLCAGISVHTLADLCCVFPDTVSNIIACLIRAIPDIVSDFV